MGYCGAVLYMRNMQWSEMWRAQHTMELAPSPCATFLCPEADTEGVSFAQILVNMSP